ncbi:hypothetical protein, partial [Limnohabitans sp.]|uniref:hypothetical protein n=1 Tax=Limnohabitans sp. TaxID=1907725 RepID=UPI0037BE8F57
VSDREKIGPQVFASPIAVGDRSYKEATPILFVGAVSDREKIGPQVFATPIAVGDRSYKEATPILFVGAVSDREKIGPRCLPHPSRSVTAPTKRPPQFFS